MRGQCSLTGPLGVGVLMQGLSGLDISIPGSCRSPCIGVVIYVCANNSSVFLMSLPTTE